MGRVCYTCGEFHGPRGECPFCTAPTWDHLVEVRAAKEHAHKRRVKKQKQHLRAIKSENQLRAMRLASRVKQKRR